jgi:hypothetical protein
MYLRALFLSHVNKHDFCDFRVRFMLLKESSVNFCVFELDANS